VILSVEMRGLYSGEGTGMGVKSTASILVRMAEESDPVKGMC
jgi:hypothetical protein